MPDTEFIDLSGRDQTIFPSNSYSRPGYLGLLHRRNKSPTRINRVYRISPIIPKTSVLSGLIAHIMKWLYDPGGVAATLRRRA